MNSDKKPAQVTKIILAVLAVGGVLVVTAMAPNIFQIFGKYKRAQKYSDGQLRSGLYVLKRRGFVEIINEKDGKTRIKLTQKGEGKIKEFSIDSLIIPKQKKWDKKWRIVIFDIPNRFNRARATLREKIREFGFYKLQKSVWIYPYPCEDEVLFVANVFNVEPFIEILTVENLLRGDKVKSFFDLLDI